MLQLGVYDPLLLPKSYAGQSTILRRRIDGLARSGRLPRIVAVGSSRTDKAFDEEIVNQHAAPGAASFINLGLMGARLRTEVAVAHYVADLDPRRPATFVLEVNPHEVIFAPDAEYEAALVAPFTPVWSNAPDLIRVFAPRLSVESMSLALRLLAFRGDFRDVLLRPRTHLKAALSRTLRAGPHHGARKDGDVCEVWDVSADECAARAKELFSRTGEARWEFTAGICAGYLKRSLTDKPPIPSSASIREWTRFLEDLKGRGSRAVLLLVPQATMELRPLPKASLDAVRSVLASFREAGLADYVDLSDLLQRGRECEWFYDPLHVNRKGAELASARLRDELARMFPVVLTDASAP